MNTRITIYLNDFVKAQNFLKDVEKFNSDVDMIRGRYIIDAKSTIGIFTFDLSKPINVEIHSDDEEEIKRFNEVMKKYGI